MGSFRHYFKRNNHHSCIYATLFRSQIYIPCLISGANSKKYKADIVEPSYYGRCIIKKISLVILLEQTTKLVLVNNYIIKKY